MNAKELRCLNEREDVEHNQEMHVLYIFASLFWCSLKCNHAYLLTEMQNTPLKVPFPLCWHECLYCAFMGQKNRMPYMYAQDAFFQLFLLPLLILPRKPFLLCFASKVIFSHELRTPMESQESFVHESKMNSPFWTSFKTGKKLEIILPPNSKFLF